VKSVDALLGGLVDYAGLFPPSAEAMPKAVANYASYLRGTDRKALGRFIVPVSRLAEFEKAAAGLLPAAGDGEPWRLSALVSGDVGVGSTEIAEFNQRHGHSTAGRAVIDVVELKATTVDDIARQSRLLPSTLTAYFEIPSNGEVGALVAAIRAARGRAKIRTGGVTADAFPPPKEVIAFISACHQAGVPFKATAGLHHPLRGEYRLTYEPGSPKAQMYGYLNVFLAAALLRDGKSVDLALRALEETDPESLVFRDGAIEWRGCSLSTSSLEAAREFAISFGSCSFREPIDELSQLTRKTEPADQ
jgi:hypothetical protein